MVKCNPERDTRHRYDELHAVPVENLCGVDIHSTACLVTCFSLYLAFLDQMEPKEIIEFREALDQIRSKLLPRILWERDRACSTPAEHGLCSANQTSSIWPPSPSSTL